MKWTSAVVNVARDLDKRGRWAVVLGIGAVLLLLALAACSNGVSDSADTSRFEGTVFNETKPATSFQLQNQLGENISLSDYHGKVVLLTFLYSNCPDVCPASTSQLIDVQALLGEEMNDDVAFVAVSVDPERDTSESVHEYIARWELDDNWDFLVGNRRQLEPIWKAYFVGSTVNLRDAGDNVHIHPDGSVHAHDGSLAANGVDALRQGILEASRAGSTISLNEGKQTTALVDDSNPENRYFVIHSAPVFLIDRDGNLRVVHTIPLEPEAIAHDIEVLAN